MTDNEENRDLIENTTPFGLLDEETQQRMSAWPHGWQVWNQMRPFANGWSEVKCSSQFASNSNSGYVFRAKPAPKPEPEPVEVQCDDATKTNATDDDLLRVIADSAQELRERGYESVVTHLAQARKT